jgi:hypothetical protein
MPSINQAFFWVSTTISVERKCTDLCFLVCFKTFSIQIFFVLCSSFFQTAPRYLSVNPFKQKDVMDSNVNTVGSLGFSRFKPVPKGTGGSKVARKVMVVIVSPDHQVVDL